MTDRPSHRLIPESAERAAATPHSRIPRWFPGSSGEQPGEAAPKTDRPRQQPTITGPHGFERAFAAGDDLGPDTVE